MADINTLAKEFTQFYYTSFDAGNDERQKLVTMYRDNSMFTFETFNLQGASAIGQRLAEFPFQRIKHDPQTIDPQPVDGNSVLIMVTGDVYTDDDPPKKFSQVFLLKNDNGYFLYNDIFRLVL
ncbi:hypothetical protein CANCADRAFT_45402 [Tortispora caseinolytica NRRL Y-17796]|uniref:Nuclear transport factor 2 n=1 Tax=Tortispora caseinolytica NRRL Y-17796 TaxID=767744 RepID=A0A1E4TB03_9ASCO|nr:hypothetical protein CANCADRAFT_45402 [Tortispora caseinolytica NRRL Y-17796]